MSNMTIFKTLIVCIGLTLGLAYVLFSYIQTSKTIQNKTESLFLQTKEEASEALEQFQRYLNLTESRLLNSLHNKDAIPQILSLRAEPFIKSRFPEIITLAFIPVTEPTASYSKYGKTVLTTDAQQGKEENGIIHLGKGTFKSNKILYDQKQKPFGKLHMTFSMESFLYKYFSENEISLLPKNQLDFRDNLFSFKLLSLPYGLVLNKTSLSFQEFLSDFKWQILTALVFGISLLISGIAAGTFFKHKIILKYRTLNQQLRDALRTFEKKYADLCAESLASQNLLKIKDKAKKGETLLSNTLQDRYRQMAAQAQSINILTLRLIDEEAGNDKLLKEIHSVSKEGTSVLGHLVNGYPAKEIEENINVLESIKNIKTIFLPEIMERNIAFEIKGKVKKHPVLDKLTFEIVVHNIFYVVMDRLNQNNSFKINLKESQSLEITFYDNGYDIEAKLYKVKNSRGYEDFLRLEKNRLREFTRYLGWELYFQSGKNSLNSIKLSIPQAFQEKALPTNVINLFDFQPAGV